MAVDPRRRRRKIDPDHAKRKRIKKAVRTAGSPLIPGGGGAAEALEGALKKSRYGKKAREPRGRAKGVSPQGIAKSHMDSTLYGDWMQQESQAGTPDPRARGGDRTKLIYKDEMQKRKRRKIKYKTPPE